MLPTLLPHLALGALAIGGAIAAWRFHPHLGGAGGGRRETAAALAVAALGVAVAVFHRARFPYFWMTLGLFPAVAIALALDPLLGWVDGAGRNRVAGPGRRRGRAAAWTLAAALGALAVAGLPAAVGMLDDTQAVQRRTLAFVDRHFALGVPGFQADGALFCRDPGSEPLPIFLGAYIFQRLWGPGSEPEVAALLDRFRRRPFVFVIDSFHLWDLPPPLAGFFRDHYRLYSAKVMLPAAELGADGPAGGGETRFEILVPGRYRWRPAARRGGAIAVDGRAVEAGGTVELAAGEHRAELPAGGRGRLEWAVDEPPAPEAGPFYGRAMTAEM
jgi:hypothetical protein